MDANFIFLNKGKVISLMYLGEFGDLHGLGRKLNSGSCREPAHNGPVP